MALTFEAAKGRVTARRLLSHIAPVATGQIVLVLAIYLVLMFMVFADRVPLAAALVTIPALPAMIWQNYGLAVIQGHHDFRALHVLRTVPSGLYAIGLILLLIFDQGSVTSVMAAWSGTYVVAAVATHVYIHRAYVHDDGRELPPLSSMARFGSAAFLGSSSPLEIFRADQLLVGLMLTTVELAYYSTALAFCNFPRFVSQALGLVAFAKISAMTNLKEQDRLAARYAMAGLAMALIITIPLVILANPLIRITFGAEFTSASTITQLLLGANVFLCVRRILSDSLRGRNLPEAGSIAEVTSLLVLVPAAAILAPKYGLDGFGIAMIACYVVGLVVIVAYWQFKRRRPKLSDAVGSETQRTESA